MANSSIDSNAAPAPCRDALALRLGAAQPPLDLSLGHIGTLEDVYECDVVTFGPYVVTLNYSAMCCEVSLDPRIPTFRQDRRAGLRKVQRLVSVVRKAGMTVVEGEAL